MLRGSPNILVNIGGNPNFIVSALNVYACTCRISLNSGTTGNKIAWDLACLSGRKILARETILDASVRSLRTVLERSVL